MKESNVLFAQVNVDAIVMLTWSNWFTELRSNRYHYATRFASHLPVLFVQPDLTDVSYSFEETGIENITIIHIFQNYGAHQSRLLNQALLDKGCISPIIWIYNSYFVHFLKNRYSVLNIYHATEDYLCSDSHLKFKDKSLLKAYYNTINLCQLIICVSDGVQSCIEKKMVLKQKIITIPNGCDYKFYSSLLNLKLEKNECNQKTVFYQGNIFDKLDYALLLELVDKMPDWIFNFCGKVVFNEETWQILCKKPNVNYLGLLTAEEVREQSYQATVGIIPFVQTEWLVVRSFPLKTFEYLAAGLAVVSIPIDSIQHFSDVILFASTADEFKSAIEQAELLRWDKEHTQRRLKVAAEQDYDIRFQDAIQTMKQVFKCEDNIQKIKLQILSAVWKINFIRRLCLFQNTLVTIRIKSYSVVRKNIPKPIKIFVKKFIIK